MVATRAILTHPNQIKQLSALYDTVVRENYGNSSKNSSPCDADPSTHTPQLTLAPIRLQLAQKTV